MKLTPVACQNCGASLEVPDNARFVTCQFCRTQLSVQHTGSAIYTELLGDLAERTTRMAENLEAIRIQNEIEKLDREWEARRAPYLTRHENGGTTEPSTTGAATSGFGLLGFGIAMAIGFLVITEKESHPPYFVLIIPVLLMMGGLHQRITGPDKAEAYERLRRAYEEDRRSLELKLREFPAAN